MEAIIEIEEAGVIKFDPNKKYKVLHNFNPSEVMGIGKVYLKDGLMCADIKLNQKGKGLFPAVGYNQEDKSLVTLGLCENPNLDENIKPI